MKKIAFILVLLILLIGCSKPTAEELFNEGANAQADGLFDLAIEKYKELIDTYPDSARVPEAYYAIANIYQDYKQSHHQAINMFRRLVEKYPQHPVAPNAAFRIGYIYNNDLHNLDSAKIVYEDFLKRYPNDYLVNSVEFELENLGKSPEEILKKQMEKAKEEERASQIAERSGKSKSKKKAIQK